jgi:cytochrome c553
MTRLGWLTPGGCLLVLMIGSPGALADPPPAPGGAPDTIAARVQGCSTCHGAQGQGTQDDYFPRIAGKPAGYLFNQLQNFREGHRSYPPMSYLLAYLHDDYLQQIAQYFAAERVPFLPAAPVAATSAQLAEGAALVRQGDSRRGIPPCMACHGSALTGINPGVPGLIGLHARYISAELEAWRAGTRHALTPDCMSAVAHLLTEEQVSAVAAWLATQPIPVSPDPAPVGQWKTPLLCGSQPQ